MLRLIRALLRRPANAVWKRSWRHCGHRLFDVRFRSKADQDIEDITRYSRAEFGNDVARAYLDSFDEVWFLLREHPKIGAEFGRRGRKIIRSYACRSHRIFYTVEARCIWIVRILHQSRDYERAMRGNV